MTNKKSTQAKFTFETALHELESIVESMEHGNLSLEESLQSFEKGIALTRQCQNALKESEQKVKILVAQDNDLKSYDNVAFEGEGDKN